MKKSIFSSIYDDAKDKYLKLIPKFKNSKLIFDDDDVLIFDIGSEHDIDLFTDEYYPIWEVGIVKKYAIVDFENKKEPIFVVVYPDGRIHSDSNIKDFGYKFKLKPYTKDEIQKIPFQKLATAVSNDTVDIDFFDFDIQLKLIAQKAKLIRKLNPDLLSDDEFISLVDANPNASKHLSKKYLLRYKKAKLNPEQRQTLEDQDLYVFLAKDKFVETKDGMYKKDLEIENLVKVDQYSKEGQTAIAMLQMRARAQGDVDLYILWVNKGLIEDVLNDQPWKINDDNYAYLRQSIRDKMIPARVNQKSL